MKNFCFILTIAFFVNSSNAYATGQFERMKNGEVIVEDSVNKSAKHGSVKMSFIIHSTPEKIWNLLVQYDKWPAFMPDLEKVVIRENKPDHTVMPILVNCYLLLPVLFY